MKLHEHLSSATYGYDTSIHLLRIGFSISSPRRPSSPADYIYIHISFFSPDEGCLDWKTDRNDVGYVLHALHSSGEIHKLHPYLLGHTQKQLPVCTAEPFSWKCSKHMQKKDTFFAVLFSACMSPHLQASPPISRFQLPISSTELTKSKQNEKSSFPPCPPPSSSFQVSAENKRKVGKVEKVCRQFIRRSEQSGAARGVWGMERWCAVNLS